MAEESHSFFQNLLNAKVPSTFEEWGLMPSPGVTAVTNRALMALVSMHTGSSVSSKLKATLDEN